MDLYIHEKQKYIVEKTKYLSVKNNVKLNDINRKKSIKKRGGKMKFTSIILAAGSGTRVGFDYNKIFIKINGKKVIDYSVDFFKNYEQCGQIVLVCSEQDFNFIYDNYSDKVDHVIIGGSTRQESVFEGLKLALNDYVLVHDSARPCIVKNKIDQLLTSLIDTSATTLAVFVKDSIIESSGNRLGKALDRSRLLAIQTPQAFKTRLLLDAHEKANKVGYLATDDTDLVAKFTNITPGFVIGDYRSIKLTTKEDIEFLKVIL